MQLTARQGEWACGPPLGRDRAIGTLKQYTNNNPERKYLCMNPFGNAYTFSMGTTTDRTKVQLNAAERVRAIDVTFKVELIEEEIRR